MDRRATLATLLGRTTQKKNARSTTASPVVSGILPYTGPWEFAQAAHLLRRAMFGPNYQQIKDAVANGMEATVDQLLADLAMPDPPLNYNFNQDPNVPIGATWIDAPYSPTVNFLNYRYQSLYGWTIEQIFSEGVSIREKMTLFWHNHFVTASGIVVDTKFVYNYISLLRENSLGNFRELVKAITINPAMLRYLNGNQNNKFAPNENYARELLELFTIGKGELAGPGDYTTFTEEDVIEIARVLTGWIDVGYFTNNPDVEVGSTFLPALHDLAPKQLSHRFDNATITNAGENEYSNLIDIIFQPDEVARFICRKIYRWFIYYEIDDFIEANVIEPLAQVMIDNDYDIKPVMETLLKSEHFYDMLNVGPMIKNPVDFLASTFKPFQVEFPTQLNQKYQAHLLPAQTLSAMQMEVYNPPEVAGWAAYYQEPQYYRTWINSVTLPFRMQVTDLMTTFGYTAGGFQVRIDVFAFVASLDDPLDPNSVITEMASILMPQPLTQAQVDYLKNVLIPGLPDFEWTIEYQEYLSDPSNPVVAASVEFKLRSLLKAMLNMPEFYLS
jgi:hypothetical protein